MSRNATLRQQAGRPTLHAPGVARAQRAYLQGYSDGVLGLVSDVTGGAPAPRGAAASGAGLSARDAARSGGARAGQAPRLKAAALGVRVTDATDEAAIAIPRVGWLAVTVKSEYVPTIVQVVGRLKSAGMNVERVDAGAGVIVGYVVKARILPIRDALRGVEGVQGVEDALMVAVTLTGEARPDVDLIASRMSAAGMLVRDIAPTLGMIRGVVREADVEAIAREEGVMSVDRITA
ncbi:hypothetical protein WME91_07200 [Sorangium sp. So ce269]